MQAHLVSGEGSWKAMLASKRDSRAGSRSCLRLVAPRTTVREPWAKPSIWRSSTPSTRRVASCISELQPALVGRQKLGRSALLHRVQLVWASCANVACQI